MFAKSLAVLALGLAGLWGPALAQTPTPAQIPPQTPPPLSAYGRLPSLEDVKISPDGKLLAVSLSDGEQRLVMIRRLDGTTVTGINMGEVKLRNVQWASPEHLLVMSSKTAEVMGLSGPKREYYMAVHLNIATGKQVHLLRSQPNAMNVVLDTPMVRKIDNVPHAFLEGVHFVNGRGQNTLYRVNLQTGMTRMLDYGASDDTDGWLVDASGEPVAQSLYEQKRGLWSLKMKIAGHWKTVDQAVSPMGSHGLSGFGRDGRSILVRRADEQNQTLLREYAADGTHRDLPQGLGLKGLLHDPADLSLLGGVTLAGDDLRYIFFSPQGQAAWDTAAKAFPGDRVSLASWSQDRRKIIVHVDSPVEGPAYALVDMDAKSARWLGMVYGGVTSEGISPVRSIRYKARDGLQISGYLTLPRGRAPKNLPLVVLPHGGPEGRDTPGFDWWSQALASRGYAVLQPNFRGSEGFGWDFVKAGFGQWGKAMQTDLSDGVRDLAAQGLIDPKRVCIVGASYGGYAALAGATLDKGVYRCATSVAGPSDLRRMLQDNQKRYLTSTNAAMRYWLRFMGADGLKDPDLATISPARLADQVEIPILLIHGKDDTVVPYEQSQIMAAALKKAGKPVTLVTLNGEDHWLSSGATRLTMLTSTVEFLERHNPPN